MDADLSLEQITAGMSEAEQEEVLADLDLDELPWDWRWTGRPSQILPVLPDEGGNDWSRTLLLGGRGMGKTLSGNEWIREVDEHWTQLHRAPKGIRLRVALLGRTAADVRDTLVQGESGLLAVYPPSLRDAVHYIPSRRRVDLPGGGMVTCFSADEPNQLRGPQFHIGFADELAAHKQVTGEDNLTAWQNLEFAVRLGKVPQILAATTPKRVKSLKKLLADAKTNPRYLIRRGRTADNVHLDEAWYQTLVDTYGGTELGRQELDGELLGKVSGALTSQDFLDLARLDELPYQPSPWLKFTGLDPSTSEKHRDEAGIITVYVPRIAPVSRRHAYVVEDVSDNYTPDEWAEQAVRAANRHGSTIIAEVNQGGAMVKSALRQVADDLGMPMPPYRETWSSKAKAIRAEPVGVALARGRVHMVGKHELLEDELVSWVPQDRWSPNRLDALVFATVAGLFDQGLVQGSPGSATTLSIPDSRRQIPLVKQVDQLTPRQQERAGVQVRRGQLRIGRTAV